MEELHDPTYKPRDQNPTLIQVVKSATIREFILTRGTKSKFLAPSSGAGPLNYDYGTYGTFGGTDSHHPHGLGRQFDNLWKRHELAEALKLSLSLSFLPISFLLFFWFLAPLMFIHTYMFCFCRNWPISVLFSGTRTGILISPQL